MPYISPIQFLQANSIQNKILNDLMIHISIQNSTPMSTLPLFPPVTNAILVGADIPLKMILLNDLEYFDCVWMFVLCMKE